MQTVWLSTIKYFLTLLHSLPTLRIDITSYGRHYSWSIGKNKWIRTLSIVKWWRLIYKNWFQLMSSFAIISKTFQCMIYAPECIYKWILMQSKSIHRRQMLRSRNICSFWCLRHTFPWILKQTLEKYVEKQSISWFRLFHFRFELRGKYLRREQWDTKTNEMESY